MSADVGQEVVELMIPANKVGLVIGGCQDPDPLDWELN